MLDHVTVAVGNRAEVEVAVGTDDPAQAAAHLLARGVRLAVVKQGAAGVLVATEEGVDDPAAPGTGAVRARGGRCVRWCCPRPAGWRRTRHGSHATPMPPKGIVASQLACADAMPGPAEIAELLDEPGTALCIEPEQEVDR